jgi:hypothetical protein
MAITLAIKKGDFIARTTKKILEFLASLLMFFSALDFISKITYFLAHHAEQSMIVFK